MDTTQSRNAEPVLWRVVRRSETPSRSEPDRARRNSRDPALWRGRQSAAGTLRRVHRAVAQLLFHEIARIGDRGVLYPALRIEGRGQFRVNAGPIGGNVE